MPAFLQGDESHSSISVGRVTSRRENFAANERKKEAGLTRLASVSRPAGGASAVEVAVGFAAHAFVLARRDGARVLHDLAVGA